MSDYGTVIDNVRAGLALHGLFLRGVVHFDGDGPQLSDGAQAQTVVLVGNIGSSIWPSFSTWRRGWAGVVDDPLDHWSESVIVPLASAVAGTAYFPSRKPWHPFQQWAMRAEGLKTSPLGILIHPEFGLWHGYRGAIGFGTRMGIATVPLDQHPCDHCPEKPCLAHCPVDAVTASTFDIHACRSHIQSPTGQAGCIVSGCLARNACPVGARYRYRPEQLRFHMAALGRL